MKTTYKLFTLFAVAAVLTSCSSEQDEIGQGEKYLQLTTTIEQEDCTRAGINSTYFDTNDSIGIFLGSASKDGIIVGSASNVKATYNNGWSLSTPIALETTSSTVYAYYPYDSKSQGVMTLDARTQTNYLYAISENGVSRDNNTAQLTFHHAMPKVRFVISSNKSRKLASVELSNIMYNASINIATMKGILSKDLGTIEPAKEMMPTNTGTSHTVEFLLLPNCGTQNVTLTYVYTDGVKYITSVPLENLTMGKFYTYNVQCDK